MKKTFKYLLLSLMIAPVAMTGCKKGDGDPFLSLKSRKARFTGEWTVTAGKGSDSGNGSASSWTYDGSQKVTTFTSPTAFSTTNKYTVEYDIEKDGSFTMTNTDNNASTAVVTTIKGTWNFTGRVGELKNKQQVLFTITSVSSSGGTVTYAGSDCPTQLIELYELKNKEIIIKSTGSDSSNSTTTEEEWTWTAK